jgi:HEAT repeat protein
MLMGKLAFCPKCYRQIPVDAEVCPYCRTSLYEWAKKTYSQRLIDALGHPLDDVRMRAIIALGLRGEKVAEQPLIDCALRHQIDILEGLEIVNSLRLIRDKGSDDTALRTLSVRHPARAVRAAAAESLSKAPSWQKRDTVIRD